MSSEEERKAGRKERETIGKEESEKESKCEGKKPWRRKRRTKTASFNSDNCFI